MQIIVRCSNLDFNKTYKQFQSSQDLVNVRLDNDPVGNIIFDIRRDSEVTVQISPKGKISFWYPTERGSLFWFKVWAKVSPNLRQTGKEEIKWEFKLAQDIGGVRLETPDKALVQLIYEFEETGKLPSDHIMMPKKPSKKIAKYHAKFFEDASNWDSIFPPEP